MLRNKLSFIVLFVSLTAFGKQVFLFKGETLKGNSFHLEEALKTRKFIFLSFWASWCGPCLKELKQVSEGLRQNTSLPLEIVSVNVDTPEQKTVVKSLTRQFGFDFHIVLDPTMSILSQFKSDQALPLSYLVSPDGKILKTYNAYDEKIFEEVSNKIQNPI